MKWKYISSLKTRIYPQRFPNAWAVTWSLVLQMRNLANKIEEFSKCDDFSGEISSSHRYVVTNLALMYLGVKSSR
jgi:hypothetical protein